MRPSQPLRSLQRPLANPGSLFQSQHFYGNKAIAQLSNKPALPISLKQMMAFGKGISEDRLIQSANFVRQELPVRIAHRVRDLQNLPFVVGLNPSLEAVYKGYLAAFEQVRRWPAIRTLEENDVFADFLKDLLESHWITIPRMMVGLIESQPHLPGAARERFMTRMLRSRISRRVLAEQHIALTAQFHDAQEHGPTEDGGRHIGIINTKLSPHDSLTGLIGVLPLATGVSEANCDIVLDGNKTVTFAFIEEHLRYIVFELLKNSILAATEAGTRPHVTVTVADSPKVIGVRVSDQSGGIAPDSHREIDLDGRELLKASRISRLSFAHPQSVSALQTLRQMSRLGATISEQVEQDADERLGPPGQRKKLGIGLALSKTYAEYFGGHLELYSAWGHGTDAYLSIPKLGLQTSAT